MPNPNDPSQWECRRCHDTGFTPLTDRLCECVAGDLPKAIAVTNIREAQRIMGDAKVQWAMEVLRLAGQAVR